MKKAIILGLIALTLGGTHPILRYFNSTANNQITSCGGPAVCVCQSACPDCTNCPDCKPDRQNSACPDNKANASGLIDLLGYKTVVFGREVSATCGVPSVCPDCMPPKPDKQPSIAIPKPAGTAVGTVGGSIVNAAMSAKNAARPLKSVMNVYKNLNDYYIEFFEKNIVKRPVVSKYSKEELEKMASENGVDFYKMRVMLVVEAVYQMNGQPKNLSDIKKMSVPELTKVIFETKNKFFQSLSPEEKAKFEAEYKAQKQRQ